MLQPSTRLPPLGLEPPYKKVEPTNRNFEYSDLAYFTGLKSE